MPRKPVRDRGVRWGEGFIQERTTAGGETRFQARWPELDGRGQTRFRAKSFRTRDAAEDHLRTVGRDKRAGRYQPESTLTVQEIIDEYMERASRRWKPNTYGTYRVYLERQIAPALGSRRIVDLTPRIVQLWIDDLVARSLSPSTIANSLTLLSSALKEATLLGLLDRNPAIGIRVPTKTPGPGLTWSVEDVRRVLTATASDPMLHALHLLALTTGMRPGEIRALQWETVDIAAGTVVCRRTITRDREMRSVMGTTTKTARSRVIAIAEPVGAALAAWRHLQVARRLAHPAWCDDDIVFDRGDGRFLPQATMQSMHRRVVALAGVPKIRMHDLRHTYATIETRAGTHPKVIAERMGHASITTTLDRYTHVSTDLQQGAAEALARRLLADDDATTSTPKTS